MTGSETASNSSSGDRSGEDLKHNFMRVMDVATDICPGCADYHIFNSLKRLAGQTIWERGARAPLVGALQPLLAALSARGQDEVDMVVAACADTAVLSTCVRAVQLHNATTLERVKFTVVDRCPTPLLLCEEFGRLHRLNVKTAVMDLPRTTGEIQADIIVLHNVFAFVPADLHADFLRTLASWLKPSGKIVIWNPVVSQDDREKHQPDVAKRIDAVKEMIEAGKLDTGVAKEKIFAKLGSGIDGNRPGQYAFGDETALPRLIGSVGLRVASMETQNIPGWFSKNYVLVVAERSGSGERT